MKVPESVKKYAREDIKEVLDSINAGNDYNDAFVKSESFEAYQAGDIDGQFSVDATFEIQFGDKDDPKVLDFTIDYVVDGEDVYVGGTTRELEEALLYRMSNLVGSRRVNSSRSVNSASKIYGADDDLEAEFENDSDMGMDDGPDMTDAGDAGDEGVDDKLDSIADDIEDMQDDIDEIQEDDVDIEMDNNIEGHFIAECEKCHGIFISAMVESDQVVDKITGICPLCEKESDQYFKWVVKPIENK